MTELDEMSLDELFDHVLNHLAETIKQLQNKQAAMSYQTDTSAGFQRRSAVLSRGSELLKRLGGEIAGIRTAYRRSSPKKARRSEPKIRIRLLETWTLSHYARAVAEQKP